MSVSSHCIIYHIDKDNKITFINDEWSAFAAENQGGHLSKEFILKKPLFSFITDESTKQLYSMLVQQARETQQSVTFSFRCDAPKKRRHMLMEIFPLNFDSVGFKSWMIREQPRPAVSLFDVGVDRSDEFVKVCSWCMKFKVDDSDWVEVEEAIKRLRLFYAVKLPQLTHGMCPMCHDSYKRKLLDRRIP